MLKLQITNPRPVPSRLADSGVSVHSWHDPAESPSAHAYRHQGEWWVEVPGYARFRFGHGDTVFAFSERGASIEAIQEVYLRSVLPIALQARGMEVLHASAVRFSGGVVAFCAESETGKSTIAYGLSRRGYPLWGDDAVAFDASQQNVQAIPVPFKIHLRPAPAAFFGRVPARGGTDQLPTERASVIAVCALKRQACAASGHPVQIARLSPTRAFTAVLPHAYCFSFQDTERNRRMMQQYLELSARVPVFAVHLQTGLDNLATVLDGIVQSISGVACGT